MKIAIVGTGYVGTALSCGFAKKNHEVVCSDLDKDKIREINNGNLPFFEKDLGNFIKDSVSKGLLRGTTSTVDAVEGADVIFLAVDTPVGKDGEINLESIKEASKDIAKGLENNKSYSVVAVKSTVTPKTTEEVIIPVLEQSGKTLGEEIGVCVNPEFLREGTALNDFLNPDRIVIGELDQKSGDKLEQVYRDFDAPIMRTGLREAELIKCASNSLLATKISFINEIGNLCKKIDIDIYDIVDGVAMDSRIERSFLNSGAGFGGSCFPKDVRALIKNIKDKGEDASILEEVVNTNDRQKTRIVDQLDQEINISDSTVAILGLSFKPGTDDIRNSPAIDIISELKNKGARVKAYDPEAMANMRKEHGSIEYVKNYREALNNCDAALIVTDWPEFNKIDRGDLKSMNNPLIIEGRKLEYDIPDKSRKGITWP